RFSRKHAIDAELTFTVFHYAKIAFQALAQLRRQRILNRFRQINPECRVTVVDDFVTPDNVAQYMSVGYSYVIDAIDSVRP
ncbi:hypothetical protein ACSLOB_30090, partial [Escherichia coli]